MCRARAPIRVAGVIFPRGKKENPTSLRLKWSRTFFSMRHEKPPELAAAQEHLADWIGATFSGKNRHYGSSEDWNPAGLASYARRLLADEMRRVVGFVPSDDTETIFAVALIYRRDLESALDSHVKSGGDAASFALSAASVDLIHRWSRLMTGAPVELLLRR